MAEDAWIKDLDPRDVADVYSHVWRSWPNPDTRSGLCEIAGLALWAHDSPFQIKRMESREVLAPVVWGLRFDFYEPRLDVANSYISVYSPSRYDNRTFARHLGILVVRRIFGDVHAFERDWLVLKLNEHVWATKNLR